MLYEVITGVALSGPLELPCMLASQFLSNAPGNLRRQRPGMKEDGSSYNFV